MQLFLIVLLFAQHTLQQGCLIDPWGFDPCQETIEPLFLDKNTYDFLYPTSTDDVTLTIPVNEIIVIACPTGYLSVGSEVLNSTEFAVCNQNFDFEINGVTFNFTGIICNHPYHHLGSIRELSEESCGPNATSIEIGFPLDIDTKFLHQSYVCFDEELKVAQYANYHVAPYTGGSTSLYVSADTVQDTYYNTSIDLRNLYSTEGQLANINPQVGLPVNSTKYFNDDNLNLESFLLTDDASFLYGSQQLAAFRYINTAPMWTRFDFGGNWFDVKQAIRNFSYNYGLNLEVYTGTHGIFTLPHEETGEEVEIYLHQSEEEGKLVSVPKYFWSVVYEPILKRAVTVVLHNSPFLDFKTIENICLDISEDVIWLSWNNPDDVRLGYVYVCSYEDLKDVVPFVPDLEVTGVLL